MHLTSHEQRLVLKSQPSSAGTLQLNNRRLIGCLKSAICSARLTQYSNLLKKRLNLNHFDVKQIRNNKIFFHIHVLFDSYINLQNITLQLVIMSIIKMTFVPEALQYRQRKGLIRS